MGERDVLGAWIEANQRAYCPQAGDLYVHHLVGDDYPNATVYEVVTLCLREIDLEPCVVYRDTRKGFVWSRPLSEFRGYVTVERDGGPLSIPRFQYVGRGAK